MKNMTLNVKDVTYSIGGKEILRDIDLSIRKGESVALLGPNGAGKSTLIDLITGHLPLQQGHIDLLSGHSFWQVRSKVHVMYEYIPLYLYYKVREMIAFVCSVCGVDPARIGELTSQLEIDRIEDKPIRVLSKGERKKLGILITLIGDPEFVILDEPTSDLDPFIRDTVWKLFKSEGRTVFFTTHMWDEALLAADRVALIAGGSLLAVDTPEHFLSDKYLKCKHKVVLDLNHLPAIGPNIAHAVHNEQLLVYPESVDELLAAHDFSSYSVEKIDLKDIYLHLLHSPKGTTRQ